MFPTTLLAALVTGQVLTAVGLNAALHSITIIQVPQDADRYMDEDQVNWTIAAGALAYVVGALLAAYVAPKLGARRLLMLTMPAHALASLMPALGGTFAWVLLGRLTMYVAVGMSEGTARSYVSEVVAPKKRTLYTAVLNTMVFLPQSAAMLLGPYLHWTAIFLVAGFVPAAVCLPGLYFIPNSAKWLLSHGHSEREALRSIRFFHGKDFDAEAEVHSVRDSLKHTHVDGVFIPMRKVLFRQETLHPLLLATAQFFMFIWTGGVGISVITAFILEPVDLSLDEYQRALLPNVVAAVVGIPGSLLVDRFGRLPLLRAGGSISGLGCAAIAAYFFLPEELQQSTGWIVLVGAALTQVAWAGFIASVSLTYANELLPNRTRILGVNILVSLLYADLFIFVKTYPLLRDSLGFGGVFVIHLIVCGLQVLLATFCLPETKGLTMEQIQKLFQKEEEAIELE